MRCYIWLVEITKDIQPIIEWGKYPTADTMETFPRSIYHEPSRLVLYQIPLLQVQSVRMLLSISADGHKVFPTLKWKEQRIKRKRHYFLWSSNAFYNSYL